MYYDHIKINKRFKSSVNLAYDLYNEDKISQYVPTTDLCDVIKSYAKAIINNEEKSTILAGPYGKGKSYLMLMLTFLFSKRENQELFQLVLKKINNIDEELAEILLNMNKKEISLLPVIITNSSFDDINKNFMIALNNALSDHGILDIIPSTVFNECLNLISEWENNKEGTFDILDLCLKKLGVNLKELKNGLKNYDLKYYRLFEDLFNCVSHGYKFNPLISNDIGLIYSDVSRKINKYGYSGLFVIYDEFGSFLDNQSGDFTGRLNQIQSFAEKANSSDKTNQIHFCCVAHKDIRLYCDKDNEYKNSFETIAGRFKQKRFDRTLDENYQIICQALEKENTYEKFRQSNDYTKFISELKKSGIFSNISQVDYIFDNGFPFNPVSLYALVQSSEKLAQNERTLFTFLSDTDVNSFIYFVKNNDSGLLNVPVIYDYFKSLIYNNFEYKNIYFKVESLKRLTTKKIEREIIKVIALMKIIDDDIKYSSTVNNIALSMNQDFTITSEIIDSMIKRNLIKRNINDNTIDFDILADNKVNELINNIVIQKISHESLSNLLDKFDTNVYHISNEYNFKKKMVRFYKSIYLESSTFMELRDLTTLFIGHECDGLIINLINDNKTNITQVKEKLKQKNYENIIVRFKGTMISEYAIDKLKKIYAAKQLLMQRDISDYLKATLPIFIDDSSRELNKYLTDFYSDSRSLNCCDFKITKLGECINNSLDWVYNKTIILNNELVNKNSITPVTTKARNIVIDDILLGKQRDYGSTSQEATINTSFLESVKNNSEIIDIIKNWIISSNSQKICFTDLINMLKRPPYGMRNGIIPLFIASAINKISIKSNNESVEAIVIYNETKEIELNAVNLSKVVLVPGKYYLKYTLINSNKLKVINSLIKNFGGDEFNNLNETISFLLKRIKYRMNNMADIIINSTLRDNLLNLSVNELSFKENLLQHDLNNYFVLFEKLPKSLNCEFDDLSEKIIETFNSIETKLENYKLAIVEKTKREFIYSETIKASYELWKSKYPLIDNVIFESNEKKMYQAFKNIAYNDFDALDLLSNSLLGCTLSGWNSKREEIFFDVVKKFKNQVESSRNVSSNLKDDLSGLNDYKMTSLGKTLYSNLSDSLEEYGESLSNEEKAMILRKLLSEVIG